jgi:hypothetical protein
MVMRRVGSPGVFVVVMSEVDPFVRTSERGA